MIGYLHFLSVIATSTIEVGNALANIVMCLQKMPLIFSGMCIFWFKLVTNSKERKVIKYESIFLILVFNYISVWV